jgi:hypothetical protein
MNNPDEASRPRRVVLDVVGPSPPVNHTNQHRKRNKRRGGGHPHQHVIEEDVIFPPCPLEMRPVIEATLQYGRRTHALGALEGAEALDDVVKRIKMLAPLSDTIIEIIKHAESRVSELKGLLITAYSED